MAHRHGPELDEGRYVFGLNPVLELLRADPERIEGLYVADGAQAAQAGELRQLAEGAKIRLERVHRDRLAELAGRGAVHQGVVAKVRSFAYAELDELVSAAKQKGEDPLIVVLDGIQDPQNLGAIIRSAHALGAHGVVIPKDRAAQLTGAVAKASAGALAHTLVARVTNLSRALDELKEAGLWIAAADPGGDVLLWEAKLEGPLAIVVGAEGPGVRPGVLGRCDFKVRIPLSGKVASLNASVSAALLLYEVVRRRPSR